MDEEGVTPDSRFARRSRSAMEGASRCSSGRSGSIEFVRCGFVSFEPSLWG